MADIKEENIQSYLIDKVNYGITETSNKFAKENISFMLKTIGFAYDQINEYLIKQHTFKNVEGNHYRFYVHHRFGNFIILR